MTLQSPGSSWPERCWLWGNIVGQPNSSLLLVGPDFFHYFFLCFWILLLLQVWRCWGFPPPFFLLMAMLELKPHPPLHMPDSPSTSVRLTWNVPHRPVCLPTYSPAVGAIFKNCISFGEWSLDEGSGHSLVTKTLFSWSCLSVTLSQQEKKDPTHHQATPLCSALLCHMCMETQHTFGSKHMKHS